MYTVEYLILLDDTKTKCKTVKALKSLLESDSEIVIDKNQITYNKYSCSINLQLGKNENIAHLFFDITLKCEADNDIQKFSTLLKAVRTALNLISGNQYVIWDDLSLFYARHAYPVVFDIENMMRKLITKFMLTNIGIGWTKERVPTDVQQSINSSNKDINYLNNVDFIQLKNFLFSENYPSHRENLIQKLKTAKDFSNLDLNEIKSLLPDSNWNKYFATMVGCDAEYLRKRWDRLYELRTSIAHNKSFNKTDLEQVEKLSSELKPYLNKALSALEGIVIPEEDRENLAETVAIKMSEAFGEFILWFRHLEKVMLHITKDIKLKNKNERLAGFNMQTNLLFDNGIIPELLYIGLKKVLHVRNAVVHNSDLSVTLHEIMECVSLMDEVIKFLEVYIKKNLQ